MPKNLTVKGEREEELMEVKSLLDNFIEEIGGTDTEDDPDNAKGIIDELNKTEELDHKNDRVRNQAQHFLLKSIEHDASGNHTGMQRNLHAAVQKLNEQGIIDEKDDIPRSHAKIRILRYQMKMINASNRITKLIERCGKAKK